MVFFNSVLIMILMGFLIFLIGYIIRLVIQNKWTPINFAWLLSSKVTLLIMLYFMFRYHSISFLQNVTYRDFQYLLILGIMNAGLLENLFFTKMYNLFYNITFKKVFVFVSIVSIFIVIFYTSHLLTQNPEGLALLSDSKLPGYICLFLVDGYRIDYSYVLVPLVNTLMLASLLFNVKELNKLNVWTKLLLLLCVLKYITFYIFIPNPPNSEMIVTMLLLLNILSNICFIKYLIINRGRQYDSD